MSMPGFHNFYVPAHKKMLAQIRVGLWKLIII